MAQLVVLLLRAEHAEEQLASMIAHADYLRRECEFWQEQAQRLSVDLGWAKEAR